jgi:F0F1-type ATP synthase assembly protein I
MSEDPSERSAEPERAGQSRQKMPTASPPPPPSFEERRERSTAARFAGIGLQFAVTILVSLAVGNWLDKRFGTGVFIYLAVFLGAGAAFYSMYRQLMANLEREEAAKRTRKNGSGAGSDASGGTQ